MMRTSIYSVILSLCFLSSVRIGAEETQQLTPLIHYQQDRKDPSSDNPLKGFSDFLFFPMIPASSKQSSDKLMKIVLSVLNQFGQVSTSKILKHTENSEVIDLSPLDKGAILNYQIKDLITPEGKKMGVVRASLNFSALVTVEKTGEICSPYLWGANCFLPGATDKHLDQLIKKSLENLLEQFLRDFSQVNGGSPRFDLQGAE